jgi:hypothetical protein
MVAQPMPRSKVDRVVRKPLAAAIHAQPARYSCAHAASSGGSSGPIESRLVQPASISVAVHAVAV